jgi:putative colanic acid biosynthesis acetyltransferase WcaF
MCSCTLGHADRTPESMILAKTNPFQGASFSRRSRIMRTIWQFTWLFLFRPTAPPLHAWRCWLLRCFGARIETPCYVYNDVEIWAPWNLLMAKHSTLGRRVSCYSMALVSLGERAVVSQGVHLCTGSHDYESETFQLYARPIVIGADAWICAEAFLSPGVSVGNGAVIGARSVVTRDQPAWMVCAGNPCRPLKPRTPPAYANS